MRDAPQSPPDGAASLADAQHGDQAAFDALVHPHRAELQVHCYRMLGSVHDAEDAVQDALLRAWRGLGGFEGRSSLRAWLYRIATNTCLTAIDSRSRRVLPVDLTPVTGGDAPAAEEATWLEPYPDDAVAGVEPGPSARYEQREGVELAFVAALQYLPPSQRAALILRDVLGFSAADAAEALSTTTTSINSAVQHARTNVAARVPERSQQETLRSMGDHALRQLVDRYVQAFEAADVDGIVALLAEDATWSMPPYPEWYRGHRAIASFLRRGPLTVAWRHLPTRASGQPAVGCYSWDDATGRYTARVVDVLTLDGEGRISAVTAFIDPGLFDRLGLPAELR